MNRVRLRTGAGNQGRKRQYFDFPEELFDTNLQQCVSVSINKVKTEIKLVIKNRKAKKNDEANIRWTSEKAFIQIDRGEILKEICFTEDCPYSTSKRTIRIKVTVPLEDWEENYNPISTPGRSKKDKALVELSDFLATEDKFNIWLEHNKNNPELLVSSIKNARKSMINGADNWYNREIMTASELGHIHNGAIKHGPDAHTRSGRSYEYKTEWTRNDSKNKINGGGTFNDVKNTIKLDLIYKENWGFAVSIFIEHDCIFIFDIPLEWEPLKKHLYYQAEHPKSDRNCLGFDFKHWIECPDVKIIRKPTADQFFELVDCFQKSFTKQIWRKFYK